MGTRKDELKATIIVRRTGRGHLRGSGGRGGGGYSFVAFLVL